MVNSVSQNKKVLRKAVRAWVSHTRRVDKARELGAGTVAKAAFPRPHKLEVEYSRNRLKHRANLSSGVHSKIKNRGLFEKSSFINI